MPPEVLAGLPHLLPTKLPRELLAGMLRFYVAPGNTPDLEALSFDFGVYDEVYRSLAGYDLSSTVDGLANCHLVVGKDDFISTDMIADIVQACRSFTALPHTGHFPFAENPELFRPLARRLLIGSPSAAASS
jgi:hypothetical protein